MGNEDKAWSQKNLYSRFKGLIMDMLSPDSVMKWLTGLIENKYKPEDQKNAPARDSTPANKPKRRRNPSIPQTLIDMFGGNK